MEMHVFWRQSSNFWLSIRNHLPTLFELCVVVNPTDLPLVLKFQIYKYFRFCRLFPVIGVVEITVFELAMVDSTKFAVGK